MKLKGRQIEAFVRAPDPAARVILVYGPDTGLVRERGALMGKTVVADLNDPFNAAVLSGDSLAADPARLADEANAMSMMGGNRLVRVENAGDSLTALVKDYLKTPSAHNLVILEAGELSTRSSLRLLCEKAANAAAVPCYVEDERDLAPLIRDMLRESGLSIDHGTAALFAARIAGDRARVRSEIEKLATYKGADKSPVSAEDVDACCGDAGMQSLDALVFGTGGGKAEAALRAFRTLTQEGMPVIAVLRALQNHFRRLHYAAALTASGMPQEEAMKALSPPVFYKNESDFRAQMNRWSPPALQQALQKLAALEAQCKKTGMPDETLCAQALLSLSRGRG